MNRVQPILVAVLAATVVACASSRNPGVDVDDDAGATDDALGDGTDAAPGSEVTAPMRSCQTRFGYRPIPPVTAVELVGEWDWTTRVPMADPEADGEYVVERPLAAGMWAYKLVVTRPGGAVEWMLDPGNPYRAYAGGTENSGRRVDDCMTPRLEVASHVTTADGAVTRVRLWRGASGTAIATGGVRAQVGFEGGLTPASVVIGDGELTVTLAGLPAGKHTLLVEVEDTGGARAAPVRVPFWIEPQRYDWRDALVYMVMTDRFRNGEPANDPPRQATAAATADYLGGDLRGVTAAIEDGTFEQLGVRALWLSPFVENTPRVELDGGRGVSAYHGYWPVRARTIDPRLGTEADLDAMVTAAHRRGIRVLMDYVVNHVHQGHEYYAAHPEWFRVGCECGQPGCGWTEHRLDCSFKPYLPDVDWRNRAAGEQMVADALWWLERFDLDGLRVDAVKHVEDLAIVNLSTRIHEQLEQGGTEYFLLGETAMGWAGDQLAANLPEYQTIARYLGPYALSGQFDFVLYHASAYRVWADEAKGMLHLDYWTRQSLAQYPVDAVMTPFIGSHDSERITSLAQYGSADPLVHHKWPDQGLPTAPTTDLPYQRVALALTWMLTVPGAPLLYYGDEYGEHGGADPDNRHMWTGPTGRTARQVALYDRVARAGRLRRDLEPLRRGRYVSLTVTEDVLTFARVTATEAVIVAINRAGAARTVELDLTSLGVGSGGTVVDRLDPGGRTLTVAAGRITLPLPARGAAVLTGAAVLAVQP